MWKSAIFAEFTDVRARKGHKFGEFLNPFFPPPPLENFVQLLKTPNFKNFMSHLLLNSALDVPLTKHGHFHDLEFMSRTIIA